MPNRLRDVRLQLVLVALGGLGVRLVAIGRWSQPDLPPAGDQAIYHDKANDLAEWLGFTYRHLGERVATANHPPLHTSWLGLWSLLGLDGVGHHRVAGAVLGAVTVLVAGLAARRLVGDRAGVLAALAVALAPTLWINDALITAESMFAAVVAGVLLAAGELVAAPTRWRAAVLGAVVGLAVMARAEALLLAPLLCLPLAMALGRREGSAPAAGEPADAPSPARAPDGHRALGLLVAMAVGVVATAGPWVARNQVAFGRPVVSNGTGFVLEIANCDATYQGDLLGYWSATCDRTPWEATEVATEAAKRRTGVEYVADHRDRLPVVVAARVARAWDVWRPEQSVELNRFFERRGDRSSRAALYAWWAMLVLAVPGTWALRRRPVLLVAPAAIALTTTAAAAVSFGITRYRTGLEVAVAVLAAVGVDVAWRAATRSSRSRPAAADGGRRSLATASTEVRA